VGRDDPAETHPDQGLIVATTNPQGHPGGLPAGSGMCALTWKP